MKLLQRILAKMISWITQTEKVVVNRSIRKGTQERNQQEKIRHWWN